MDITVAATSAALDEIAPYWDRLAVPTPHASRELSTLVLQTSPYAVQPYVVLIRRDGQEPILVVARIERRPLRIKVGYRTLLSIPARWLVVVAGGVVGAQTDADYELVMRMLNAALRRGEADLLELSKVEFGGPLHRVATRQLSWYRRGHIGTVLKCHRTDLSGGVAGFLAARSKRSRLRLKRRLQRLDEGGTGGQKLVVRQIGPGDDVGEVVRSLDAIAHASYQRGIGVGFVDDDLHRELVSWAVAEGPYRIWTIAMDDRPVAYLGGVRHARTFYLFETAFDPSVSDDEPGAVLLARVLEELAADAEIDTFDCGYGDAQYKLSISDECAEVVDVLGYAGRPKALLLNAIDSGVRFAVATARRALGPQRVARLRRSRRAAALPGNDAD